MDVADHAVNLYRLLVDSKRQLNFEEARDRLGLSDDEMRLVVDLLNEFFESDDRSEATV